MMSDKTPNQVMDDASETMSDLFHNKSLLTTKLSSYARERYQQALWYVWGRQDAGDTRTRDRNISKHYLGDDFGFAEFAAVEAEAFHRQKCTRLSSIGVQYDRFVAQY